MQLTTGVLIRPFLIQKVLTTIGSGSIDNDTDDKQTDVVQDKERQQHASVQAQKKRFDSFHKVSQVGSSLCAHKRWRGCWRQR